jgi:hypothetical protein
VGSWREISDRYLRRLGWGWVHFEPHRSKADWSAGEWDQKGVLAGSYSLSYSLSLIEMPKALQFGRWGRERPTSNVQLPTLKLGIRIGVLSGEVLSVKREGNPKGVLAGPYSKSYSLSFLKFWRGDEE